MTCAARRREILAWSRSRRRLRKIEVDANTARSMRRLCNDGKTQRTGWPTYRFEVCVRTGYGSQVRDDDKFDRDKNGSNDVMIRLNTVEEVKPRFYKGDGLRIPNRVHILDKVLAILKNGP